MKALHAYEREPQAVCAHAKQREIIEIAVSQVFAVPLSMLKSQSRETADIAHARQVAMYLAHVIGSMPLAEIGQAFGWDRTTVAYACNVVEDRRDEPKFNRTLDLLEGIVSRLWRLMISQPG